MLLNNIAPPPPSQGRWLFEQSAVLGSQYDLIPTRPNPPLPGKKRTYTPEPYGNGEAYPLDHVMWSRAARDCVGIRLGRLVLVDYDGYKPDSVAIDTLAEAMGFAVGDLMTHCVQWNGELTSLHFFFVMPDGINLDDFKQANNGKWLANVDIKTGNQLAYIKASKENRLNGFKPAVVPLPVLAALKKEGVSSTHINNNVTLDPEAIRIINKCDPDASYDDALTIIFGTTDQFGQGENVINTLHEFFCRCVDPTHEHRKSREWVETKVRSVTPGNGKTWGSVKFLAGETRAQVIPLRQTAQEAFKDYPLPADHPTLKCMFPPVVAHPDLMDASEIPMVSGIAGENDHALDADIILSRVFANRLAVAGGSFRWWNGRCWDVVGENDIRRLVSEAMVGAISRAKVTNSRVAGTIQLMKDRAERLAPLEPRSRLIFFKNCVFNVVTGKTESHAKENCNTFTLSVDYDPSSVCPEFLNWLGDIFDTDMDRVLLLQEFIGWGLISDNLGIQKAPLLIGAPRSGKGTALSLLREILGETATGTFLFKDMDSNKGLASLATKQIAIDSDAGSPNRNNASAVCSIFKAVTANEPVSVQLLWEQQVMQKSLNCKLYVGSNKIPNVYDDSAALANRWIPLKFNKSFLGREDNTLLERLCREKAGITIWALEGLQRLMATGRFTMPETSKDMLDSIVEASAPLERFVDEMMVLGSEEKGADSDMWDAYQSWVHRAGGERLSRPQFIKALEEIGYSKGFSRKKSMRINGQFMRGFVGVRPINKLPPPTTVQ